MNSIRMKQLIKLNYPRYGKVALQEDAHAEVAMGKGKYQIIFNIKLWQKCTHTHTAKIKNRKEKKTVVFLKLANAYIYIYLYTIATS